MGAESIASVLAMDTEPCPPPECELDMPAIPPPPRVPGDYRCETIPMPWCSDEGGLDA